MRSRPMTMMILVWSLACTGSLHPSETSAAPPQDAAIGGAPAQSRQPTVRAQSPTPAEQTCGEFRNFLPDDMPCKTGKPSAKAEFEASKTSGAFGIKIRMEVMRKGSPSFRVVPLSTPVCTGDHVAFTFTPSKPGHIHVLNHGSSGAWTQIHPDPGESSAFGPDAAVRLPPRSTDGFPVTGPPGEEHMMFFISPGPFSKAFEEERERLVGDATPPKGAGGGHRALVLRDLGRATEAYVVGEGEQTVAFPLVHAERCGSLP